MAAAYLSVPTEGAVQVQVKRENQTPGRLIG
jgi:hypothetical protein